MANILPSVGSQTANRLAQMMTANAQQKRGQALTARFGGMDERRRKMDRLFALLQQRGQQRQAERAARGPSGESRIAQTLFANTLPGAFLESDRTVSSGYQPNAANSLAGSLQQGMRGAGMGQSLMGIGNQGTSMMDSQMTDNPFWTGGGS